MEDVNSAESWVTVFTTSTDFEADLVRDRLGDAGIPAVVYTQRDHAFNLNVGDLAQVFVRVPPEHADEARALANAPSLTDAELESAALAADPNTADAYTPGAEAALDSGIDTISFAVPDASSSGAPPSDTGTTYGETGAGTAEMGRTDLGRGEAGRGDVGAGEAR